MDRYDLSTLAADHFVLAVALLTFLRTKGSAEVAVFIVAFEQNMKAMTANMLASAHTDRFVEALPKAEARIRAGLSQLPPTA